MDDTCVCVWGGELAGERVMTLKRQDSQTRLLKSHQPPLSAHVRRRRPPVLKGWCAAFLAYCGERDGPGDDSGACLNWEDTY